jgi:hypothetical protein
LEWGFKSLGPLLVMTAEHRIRTLADLSPFNPYPMPCVSLRVGLRMNFLFAEFQDEYSLFFTALHVRSPILRYRMRYKILLQQVFIRYLSDPVQSSSIQFNPVFVVTNYFITDRETKKKKARKKTEEWEE